MEEKALLGSTEAQGGNRKEEEEEEKEKEASPGSALQHRGTCLLESIFPPVPGLGWGGGERVKERWEEEWSKRKRRATFLPSRRSEAPPLNPPPFSPPFVRGFRPEQKTRRRRRGERLSWAIVRSYLLL